MKCYTVFKRTATHADILAAIGAADMLRSLDPVLVEGEDRFEIHVRKPLVPSDLEAVDPGYCYFERPGSKRPNLPPERIVRSNGPRAQGDTRAAVTDRMYTIAGPNKVIARYARVSREEWTGRIWEGLHGEPRFGFSSPLVQLFNPQSGKGYSLLKPSGTDRSDKTKDRWAEPFVEWLRFRGYFEGSAGCFTSGDLRLYCPIPAHIAYGDVCHGPYASRWQPTSA